MITRTYDTRLCKSFAIYSECENYRYALQRSWNAEKPLVNFLMLNPSKATERQNDPTVARCQRRAENLGYGSFVVTNLFAYRETEPDVMKAQDDPVGAENDDVILSVAERAGIVICAWGKHGAYLKRSTAVRELLQELADRIRGFVLCKWGEPGHPLYVAYEKQPLPLDQCPVIKPRRRAKSK